VQLHDLNGGIQPSGLFWIVQVPDDALKIEGLTVTLHVENASVIDDFSFLRPGGVPATVSFDMTWTAIGEVMHFRPQSTDPTDPANFAAEFRLARMTGSFSGSEAGFSFTGTGTAEGIATGNPDGSFAEMGTEQNGFFLGSNH
jgi:hypothetical protein